MSRREELLIFLSLFFSFRNLKQYGVVVSLHQPHELSGAEMALFPCRDAFVACSVLKESLEPFFADDAASALQIVPATVLTAMRGSYFGGVSNPAPWLDGKVLLPPQCIVR